MARLDRATRHLERRAASIASKHLKPEHVDGALKSLARHLTAHFTPEALAKLDPNALDDDTLGQHMAWHAQNHPNRAAPSVAQVTDPRTGKTTEMTDDEALGRMRPVNALPNLAKAQDAAIAARSGTERK